MINNLVELASCYRDNSTKQHIKHTGVVLIFNNQVYGWKNSLRDAHCEQPGSIAVDLNDNCYEAQGGDDYNGAKAWVCLKENDS